MNVKMFGIVGVVVLALVLILGNQLQLPTSPAQAASEPPSAVPVKGSATPSPAKLVLTGSAPADRANGNGAAQVRDLVVEVTSENWNDIVLQSHIQDPRQKRRVYIIFYRDDAISEEQLEEQKLLAADPNFIKTGIIPVRVNADKGKSTMPKVLESARVNMDDPEKSVRHNFYTPGSAILGWNGFLNKKLIMVMMKHAGFLPADFPVNGNGTGPPGRAAPIVTPAAGGGQQ